jgi:hypothetical protein
MQCNGIKARILIYRILFANGRSVITYNNQVFVII